MAFCGKQLHAARCSPNAVRCHGHAQPVRCHRVQHWRCARWRPRHCSWLQRWQGECSIQSIIHFIYSTPAPFALQEYALFEPGCRHVAKDIMGTNRANPAAMILSSTMMLRHLGYVSFFHSCFPTLGNEMVHGLTDRPQPRKPGEQHRRRDL